MELRQRLCDLSVMPCGILVARMIPLEIEIVQNQGLFRNLQVTKT